MPDQHVLWTALPRRADTHVLEIDVLVSPRLGVNATPGSEFKLSEFPELEHWTKTLAERLTFKVEFADGSRHDADPIVPAHLDHNAWNHLFRASTFVRPWTFKDLSQLPIHSYSVRFITAYLRDVYTDLGRRYPTRPPPRQELEPLRRTVGPVIDVRVKEEREPPPREEHDIPVPRPDVPAGPSAGSDGCLGALWHALERLCRLLGPVCRHLPPRLRYALRVVFRLLHAVLVPDPGPPPDPTRPKVSIPRTVHPSPYVTKPPLAPATLPPLEQLERELAANKAIAPATLHGSISAALAARDLTFEFARAKRFHERPESENPPASQPPPKKPKLDFHQAIGALGDYPELMRQLGLVVRLRVPRPATDPGTIRVIPLWDGGMRESDIAARTHCELDGNRFNAAHEPGSDFADGALDLRDAGDRITTDAPKFDVIQVDSDGAALKTILTAATLEREHQLDQLAVKALDRPERETLPALRSGGLAIVRADRAWHVHQHLVDAAAQQTPKPPAVAGEPAELVEALFAEDLVRGYRIEVKPDGGNWLSLCERIGTYDLVDDAGTVVRHVLETTDHGYVKRTSATATAGDGEPLYMHEALARWSGWSLAAQRPGMTLENHVEGPPPPGKPYDRPAPPRSEAETEFRLVTSFTTRPGTLPRLRFGHRYALRAICADLCGEPLASLKPTAPQTEALTYRRFEPAGPPAPLALRKFWPGESLERIVLRSDFDRDNATYDQQEMSAAPPEAAAHRTRQLFPPKTSQQMAELHGKLEAAFRNGATPGDPDTGYRISLRESGTFEKPKIIDVHTADIHNPQPTIPFGTPVDVGDYWINTADQTLPAPYLPDPIVTGAALRGVPGLVDAVDGDALPVHHVRAGDDPSKTEPLLQVPYTGTWPDLDAFRLRIAEQTATAQPPHWNEADRLLTVFLPKARRATVRYSSYVLPATLEAHGIWDWLDDDNPSSGLRGLAHSGAHWMITPARTLVLVHAVQHPVAPARFTQLDAVRTEIGQTTAEFSGGVLELHVASTGRIDVLGRWTEFLDDPDDGWREEDRESVAADYAVGEAWTSGMAFPPTAPGVRTSHEFGDTRHRRVKYLARATSSFREYLRENLTIPEVLRDTQAGDEVEVSILNSARPSVPAVLYAVPTFDWPATPPPTGWTNHTQTRGGGGLRVYLARPWYQSGEGELLGVVLETDQQLPEAVCSRYGLDATWSGAPAPTAVPLEPHHFPNRVAAEKVTLAEPVGLTGIAVGFRPEWDKQRKRWFCDIELDVEALPWNYWPFVRLAFVRFQPQSLPDAIISHVVLGEFGQIAPERTLSLAWQDPEHVLVTLRGRAPNEPHPPHVALRVHTTTVPAGDDPDDLDWEHAGGHPAAIDWQNFFSLVEPVDPDADGNVLWEQLVELPAPRGAQRMRLEVAEYELLRSDSDLGRGVPRLTYAAHVELD